MKVIGAGTKYYKNTITVPKFESIGYGNLLFFLFGAVFQT